VQGDPFSGQPNRERGPQLRYVRGWSKILLLDRNAKNENEEKMHVLGEGGMDGTLDGEHKGENDS